MTDPTADQAPNSAARAQAPAGHPVSRRVERVVAGRPTQDGAGVRLTRVLTPDLQERLDPFLMLDHFASDQPGDYIAGFPEHPHRGFETITYMLAGRMRHRDSAGNEGLLQGGCVQWMTAGRGVIHSEMPEQDQGLMEGFQLWLNLPSHQKMCAPGYRDIPSAQIPQWRWNTPQGEATVRVLAGHAGGVAGAVQREHTQPLLLDVHLPAGAAFWQALPPQAHAFVYPYRGEVRAGGGWVPTRHMGILEQTPQAEGVSLQAGPTALRLLLVAGHALHEPIAQHGPFVMNTREELIQAVQDYQAGRLA